MSWSIRIVLAVLATWRVTHLLASEDGPADIIVRIRRLLGQTLLGQLMDCFNCLSLWIAAPMALFVSQKPMEWLVAWLAVSGGACLLERLSHDLIGIQPVSQSPEGDFDHVLRSETSRASEQAGSGENTQSLKARV